jgi:hypothetical protein
MYCSQAWISGALSKTMKKSSGWDAAMGTGKDNSSSDAQVWAAEAEKGAPVIVVVCYFNAGLDLILVVAWHCTVSYGPIGKEALKWLEAQRLALSPCLHTLAWLAAWYGQTIGQSKQASKPNLYTSK